VYSTIVSLEFSDMLSIGPIKSFLGETSSIEIRVPFPTPFFLAQDFGREN